MNEIGLLAAAVTLLLLSGAAAAVLLRQRIGLRATGERIGTAAARFGEAQRMLTQRKRLRSAQRFTEGAVDETTRTVEGIHRGIASVPFEVLDRIPATRDTSRIVREVHDLTSSTVYGGIRGINRLLGSGLRSGLSDGTKGTKDKGHDDQ